MRTVRVQCIFIAPLLMDRMTDDTLESLRTGVRPQVSKDVPARDTAKNKIYRENGDDGHIGIPNEVLYATLVKAGCSVKNGKKNISTAKTTTLPELLSIRENFFPLHNGKTDIETMWTVDKRRGRMESGAKAVAVCLVRPKFPEGTEFELTIDFDESKVAEGTVKALVNAAGSGCGIGSFRPSCKGPFGRFRIKTEELDKVDGWKLEPKKEQQAA